MITKTKFIISFIFLVVISVITLYFNYITTKQKQEIEKLKQENTQLLTLLNSCKEENTHLIQQLQIQQEEYNKRISQLLKKSQKPPKQVKVNSELPTDYERIKNVIDQYIEAIKQ